MVALLIGSVVVGGTINVLTLREVLWREKEQSTRNLVESGFSVLTHFHNLQARGELSEAAAQTAAKDTIRAMRYDETEYFWITDLGLPVPKMVMHPTMPDLEGQFLDAAQFSGITAQRVGAGDVLAANDGKRNLFVVFVEVANQDGQGYVTYDWPKPKVGTGVTEQRYPKPSALMFPDPPVSTIN
jgi:methyl-accepting chemotaxis protein